MAVPAGASGVHSTLQTLLDQCSKLVSGRRHRSAHRDDGPDPPQVPREDTPSLFRPLQPLLAESRRLVERYSGLDSTGESQS